MGLFTRLFTRTGRKGKVVNAGRSRLCTSYKADKIEQDLRAFMLQRVYRVPNKQWLQAYDQYTNARAQDDLNACAAGRPLKWSHKVVRYDKLGLKTPDNAVKYALKKYHGFSRSDLANYNQVKDQIPYGRFSALRDIKRDRTGKAARYKFMPKLGLVRNTKSGKLMAPLQHSAPRSNYKYVPSSHPSLHQAGLGPYTKAHKQGFVQNAAPRHAEFAAYLKNNNNNTTAARRNNNAHPGYHPDYLRPPPAVRNNVHPGYLHPPHNAAGHYPVVHPPRANNARTHHNAAGHYPVVHHAAASAPRMTQAQAMAAVRNWFPARPGNTATYDVKGLDVYKRVGNRYVKNAAESAKYRRARTAVHNSAAGSNGVRAAAHNNAAGGMQRTPSRTLSRALSGAPVRSNAKMPIPSPFAALNRMPSRRFSSPAF